MTTTVPSSSAPERPGQAGAPVGPNPVQGTPASSGSVPTRTRRPFGLRDKFGYAFGDLGNDFSFILASAFLMIFYTNVLSLSAALVGTIIGDTARRRLLRRKLRHDQYGKHQHHQVNNDYCRGHQTCAKREIAERPQ